MVLRVFQELREHLVSLIHQAHQELQVLLEQVELRVLQEQIQLRVHLEFQIPLVLLVLRVHQVFQGLLEHQG